MVTTHNIYRPRGSELACVSFVCVCVGGGGIGSLDLVAFIHKLVCYDIVVLYLAIRTCSVKHLFSAKIF